MIPENPELLISFMLSVMFIVFSANSLYRGDWGFLIFWLILGFYFATQFTNGLEV